MNNIAIVGASGFIGSRLTKKCLEEGDCVYAIVRSKEKLLHILIDVYGIDLDSCELHIIESDFDDYKNLKNKLPIDTHINVVYYLSWDGYGKHTNDYEIQISNIKPVCDCLEAIHPSKFIFASSLSEYMVKKSKYCRNQSVLTEKSCNVYGATKHSARLIAQAVANDFDIDFVSVAFANVFGPGDFSNRSTNSFIKKMLNNEQINLTEGNELYDWIYIDDCISSLLEVGWVGKNNEHFYIGNTPRQLKDIVYELKSIIGSQSKLNLGEYKTEFQMNYSNVHYEESFNRLVWSDRTSFEDSINETVHWVKKYLMGDR